MGYCQSSELQYFGSSRLILRLVKAQDNQLYISKITSELYVQYSYGFTKYPSAINSRISYKQEINDEIWDHVAKTEIISEFGRIIRVRMDMYELNNYYRSLVLKESNYFWT